VFTHSRPAAAPAIDVIASVESLAIDFDGLPVPRRYFVIVIVLMTLVMVVLDGSVANLALSTIATTLRCSPDQAIWVVSSYQLAVIISLLPCGALGEKLGCRRVFLYGVAIFTLASATCAISVNLAMLVAARFVQGLGAGAIMALYSMILRYACPKCLLGTIIGLNAMTIAISAAAGPGIAGALLAIAPWPWLFAVNLPLGALVLMLSRSLPAPSGVARYLDPVVITVNAAAAMLFFSGFDRIPIAPQSGVAMIVVSIVCLVFVIWREKQIKAPLIPVDLFRNRPFRIAVLGSIACFSGQMMSYVALPFYLRQEFHLNFIMSGLYLMPCPLAVAITAPLAGRLANRTQTALLCAGGCGVLAIGLVLTALRPPSNTIITFLVGTVLAGIGFGLFLPPNNRILLLSAPKARSGAAGAMQATARLIGQTIGPISMSMVFRLVSVDTAPRTGVLVAAGFVSIGGLTSLWGLRFNEIVKSAKVSGHEKHS